jgi:hypothetical protein
MRAAVSKRESISAFSSPADSQRFKNFALANTKTLAARQLFIRGSKSCAGLHQISACENCAVERRAARTKGRF